MNFRPVKTACGHRFKVPERIQRIDSDSTHGWQLRYGRMPSEFFSDAAHSSVARIGCFIVSPCAGQNRQGVVDESFIH